MHRIIGLEFFRTGTHNNDYYGDNDLQAIADSYPELGYKAPLTCGHVNGPEARAWGWVERVYKKGQKLLADVVDIPETMFKTIKEKGFNAVSAEIFFNLTRNNKTYPRALRAIAVLGSSIPAAPVRRYVYNKEDHTMPNYADDSQRIDIPHSSVGIVISRSN